MKNVLVFKTSVTGSQELRRIEPLLNSLLTESEKWNLDLEDCDRILRVEAVSVEAGFIIEILERIGVSCAELEDELPVFCCLTEHKIHG